MNYFSTLSFCSIAWIVRVARRGFETKSSMFFGDESSSEAMAMHVKVKYDTSSRAFFKTIVQYAPMKSYNWEAYHKRRVRRTQEFNPFRCCSLFNVSDSRVMGKYCKLHVVWIHFTFFTSPPVSLNYTRFVFVVSFRHYYQTMHVNEWFTDMQKP